MDKEFKKQIEIYFQRRWSAFPVNITSHLDEEGKVTKKPHFPKKDGKPEWMHYRNEKILPENIDQEWTGFDCVAITTGKESGITVIDKDTKGEIDDPDFPQTYTVQTRKGPQFYFKYHPEVKQTQDARDKDGKLINIDIRNDGGFVFAPPSKYTLPDGTIAEYKIVKDLPLADFPMEWYEKTFKQEKNNWKEKFVQPLEAGTRNMGFSSIVGGLLKRFPMDEWESIVWPTVTDKNKLQEKPLSERELRKTFDSIAKAEKQKRHQGGDIKDTVVEVVEEDMKINIRLEQVTVCFKIKNIISNLGEANAITWIERATGLTHEIPFNLRIKSDTNKEQWVRILSKAFDKKENQEIYPWTILVAEVASAIDNHIKNRPQIFRADTIEAKEYAWLYEPFIQEDQINTFFGLGGGGKTLLALYFAKKVTQMFGYNTLFIDYEDSKESWKGKLAKITELNDFNVDLSKFFYFDSEQIPVAEQMNKIKDEIKKNNIKLVIVDSASLATGESTSDEKGAVRLASALKLFKTTVVLIAHQRKNDGDKTPIGSIQYENQSRNVWNVTGSPDDNDHHIIHVALKHTKANNTYKRRDPLGYMVEYTDDYIRITEESPQKYFRDKYTIEKNIAILLKDEGGLSAKDIAESLGKKSSHISKTLTFGKKNGVWSNDEKGVWKLNVEPKKEL